MRAWRARPLLVGLLAAVATAFGGTSVPAATAAPNDDAMTPFVIGGRDATVNYGSMASLQDRRYSGHMCGATLIARNWAVTAAHCLHEGSDKSKVLNPAGWQIRVNTHDSSRGGEVLPAAQFILHPEYTRTQRLWHDIALIRLSRSATTIPATIAAEAGPAGTATRILGWGTTCPDPRRQGPRCFPDTLQELDTSILPDSRCEFINEGSEICTDSPGRNSGVCYGDSGGPQVKKVAGQWQLIGVASHLATSRTSTCGIYPSAYVNVPVHRSWIEQHTGRL
ncbi:serine protease [Longimycelium tulufanense]|uniref:Serine protease n=1 Tax=Longimycelium tulufanense TaxID=907463 RepID=A0A8J3CCR7_9PSEU|nr:serine protease [Longimycelium tulufanense]GGM74577.1 serine protease [Longimycelium tulufanense]